MPTNVPMVDMSQSGWIEPRVLPPVQVKPQIPATAMEAAGSVSEGSGSTQPGQISPRF